MTNLDNMKNTLSSEILNLNEQQLYNLFLLLEGESDVPERFGIDSGKYYTCQKCRKEHNGCIIDDMEDFHNECYDAFIDFAIKMYHECRTDKNNQIKDIYLLIATGRF